MVPVQAVSNRRNLLHEERNWVSPVVPGAPVVVQASLEAAAAVVAVQALPAAEVAVWVAAQAALAVAVSAVQVVPVDSAPDAPGPQVASAVSGRV